ncbi:MAG TPA: hypothetical protein VKY19_27265 [Ktedonosporobacter sp.]|nr:hypothetical protein [Ktedonosporobacter sp.]
MSRIQGRETRTYRMTYRRITAIVTPCLFLAVILGVMTLQFSQQTFVQAAQHKQIPRHMNTFPLTVANKPIGGVNVGSHGPIPSTTTGRMPGTNTR